MSSGKDVINIEPRQQYLNMVLIPQIKRCEDLIYNNPDQRAQVHAVASCRGLIAILDKPSKEKLKNQLELLTFWHLNTRPVGFGHLRTEHPPLTQITLENVFNEIMDYLNNTYLLDINIGIVPSGTLGGMKERPSPDKTPATLSPRL